MVYGQSAVRQEGDKKILVIDMRGAPYGADIAVYEPAMRDVVEKLREVDVDEVVLSEYYERIYDAEQTRLLREIADLITRFEVDTVWSPSHLGTTTDSRVLAQRHDAVLGVLNGTAGDPFKSYLMLIREIKNAVASIPSLGADRAEDIKTYLATLQFMRDAFEKTQLIQRMKSYLSQLGEIPSGRNAYHSFFEVAIKPSFIGSRIFFNLAENIELVDQYEVLGSEVRIYKHPDKIEYLYFINPPEYAMPPEKYFLLEKTKEVVAAHRPEHVEFMNISQARKYFQKIYVATIADLALQNNIALSVEEKDELATIVSRYTIGYGILELFLSDRKLTDVYIDSPLGQKPIYVVHSKYGQCQTNVIFTEDESKSIVSRFRALSGRPFDQAHPILDFDLQDLQTRICVIGRPLALDGTALVFRLHKETPWTLAQFVDNKMFDSFTAGMLSFFVDAQASMLIVGSRGSGKTSMLQAMMLEIPQNLRIIVQEDSVVGDSRILVERNGKLEFTTVGALVDGLFDKHGFEEFAGRRVLRSNPEEIRVFSVDANGKTVLAPVTQFFRHGVDKDLYEVETRSGRKITVTCDHSLFTLGELGLTPVKTGELKPGDYVAVPRSLPAKALNRNGLKEFDATQELLLLNHGFVQSPDLSAWIRANRATVNKKAKEAGYHKTTTQNWVRRGLLPIPLFRYFLMENVLTSNEYIKENLSFKLENTSAPIPAKLELDDDFVTFTGLWLADGCYDGKYGVVASVDDEESRAVVKRVAAKLGLKTRMHSDGVSLIISNTNFNWFMRQILRLNGDAYTKKMPEWVYRLSKQQIASVLKGLYSGDAHVSKNEVILTLCSKELIEQVETLLSFFGIVARKHYTAKDKAFHLRIGQVEMNREFKQIGFLQQAKQNRLEALCGKSKTHDNADVVPLTKNALEFIAKNELQFNKYDYLTRGFKLGRTKLAQLANGMRAESVEAVCLQMLANSDVYWDEVKTVKNLGSQRTPVYDFSVPNCENFVCENIVAHNTQEIPVPQMKKLGFNIQRLKTRPPLGGTSETEVSAEDALRTALRLGDSVLIVGEVRSTEAKALYEAMRVGAVGNVVMGTIHGESAFSIWDRVVNDLGVPTTSFKATDFSIVSAPIRFKGSLKRDRRLIEVTEVKKHWEKDPDRENGFLEWERFDANKDALDFYEDEIKKASEWIERVKRNRGMSYEDIWREVKARGETKQYLVDLRRKLDLPLLLEAEHSVRAHNKYALLAEKMRNEIGAVEHQKLLADWRNWVNAELVKDVTAAAKAKTQG